MRICVLSDSGRTVGSPTSGRASSSPGSRTARTPGRPVGVRTSRRSSTQRRPIQRPERSTSTSRSPSDVRTQNGYGWRPRGFRGAGSSPVSCRLAGELPLHQASGPARARRHRLAVSRWTPVDRHGFGHEGTLGPRAGARRSRSPRAIPVTQAACSRTGTPSSDQASGGVPATPPAPARSIRGVRLRQGAPTIACS